MLLLVFSLVSLVRAQEVAALERVLNKAQPLVVEWTSSPHANDSPKRKICFVEDGSFVPLAQKLRERGHSVFFASHTQTVADFAVLAVSPVRTMAARFGRAFENSLAVYESLKDRGMDMIVFSSSSGAAYFSQEAKRAGLAFGSTSLVVSVNLQTKDVDEAYETLVKRFMVGMSVELADARFSMSSVESLESMFFKTSVAVWHMENVENVVSMIESMSVVVPVASKVAVTPLVSCIVTSFNRPHMLRQSVLSLQTQTYSNIEIIVVDDGSTVATMELVLASLASQKVRVVRQKNSYLGAARNNGARVAKGEYLLFLDDDNIALPNMVAVLVAAVQHSGAAIAVNAHYSWKASPTAQPPTPAEMARLPVWCPVGPAVVAGLKGNVFGNANFLISKNSFFAMSGFSEDRTGWEDYEFHAKAAIGGMDFVIVPEALMLYRLHNTQDQMSRTTDNDVNYDRVLRAYEGLLEEAGLSRHSVAERSIASCAITSVTFTSFTTVGGVNVGVCTSMQVTVVSRRTTFTDYLGVPDNVQISVNATTLLNQGSELAVAINPPTVSPGGAQTWTITLNSNSTSALSGGNGVFLIGASMNGDTGAARLACTGTQVSPTCQVPVCFHEETRVTYNDQVFSMRDFEKHSECVIPHVVSSDGVRIETSCTKKGAALRLTDDHLVFSSNGLVAAGNVRVGDILFSDEDEQHICSVVRVSRETGQKYFGLNCHKSVVLADGIKTSTFGSLHTLPALWMSWVGRLAGIDRASRWGDTIVTFVRSF